MLKVTINPHNPSGPLWLVYWDIVTKSTTFLSEVL